MTKKNSAPPSKSSWSKEDDEILRQIMLQGASNSWTEIAQVAFPDGRHETTACLDRWKILSKPKSQKGPWTSAEDNQLLAFVADLGAEKWVQIAQRLGTRSGKQCRERWHNHLDPAINKGPFTPEEDAIIFDLYSKIGSKWAEMARVLPGRPDNAIKNHFNTSLQRSKRRNSTVSNASASSSTSSQSKSASPKPAARYTPYRSRKRQDSTASLSNAPASPSPLSPHATLSRSASPADSRPRTASNRKPHLNLSLGRNLDKDFFSPNRFANAGFVASGPSTAPAADRLSMSLPSSFIPIDPALHPMPLQAAAMQATRSSDARLYSNSHDDSTDTLLAHDPHSASCASLTHSTSASSLACSSSSSSPSTPSPGIPTMHPMFASEDYDHYNHRFSLPGGSPIRGPGLQRTHSMPCVPTTPPSPSNAYYHQSYMHNAQQYSPFATKFPSHPLGVDITYELSNLPSSYFPDVNMLDTPLDTDMFLADDGASGGMLLDARTYEPDLLSRPPYADYIPPESSIESTSPPSHIVTPPMAAPLMMSPGSLTFDQASRALNDALPSTSTLHQILSTPQPADLHAPSVPRSIASRTVHSNKGVPISYEYQDEKSDPPVLVPSHAANYIGSPGTIHQPKPQRPSLLASETLNTTLDYSSPTPTSHSHASHSHYNSVLPLPFATSQA